MEEAKKKIKQLVAKYESEKAAGALRKYSEDDTKRIFIMPLFEALGWDVWKKSEVSSEEHIKGAGRPDYAFKINNITRFYLEAKKISADLDDEEFAFQAINYAWNKTVTYAVLTDFEGVKVFNSERTDRLHLIDKLIFELSYKDYEKEFETLRLLSRDSISKGELDSWAEKNGKKDKKNLVYNVVKRLNEDLNWCRERLTTAFADCNKDKKISTDLLDEGVQKLFDRLIFLRVAEDRKIEPNILLNLIREARATTDGSKIFQAMTSKFRELDKLYNSNLFTEHPFEHWNEYAGATEEVIKRLYGKQNSYKYDFSVMPTDVLGSVYENYLSHRLNQSKKGASVKEDARMRKEQGIYYTPSFIVDYIVRNALKPVLDKCRSISDLKKIKILDPACGSGSFLIKAMEVMNEKYREYGNPGDEFTKLEILKSNVFGVDLDLQAVEIARLNLLISALEKPMPMPPLEDNIKNGNSLISSTGKNAFNWQEEFPKVFKQGGFDVVIGNPPYLKELDSKELFQEIRKSNFGKYYQGKMDFWYFFLHRSIEILKDGGIMAFITNSYFLKSAGATKLIDHLHDEMVLIKAVDFQDITVFQDVSGRHLIHIWQKTKDKNNSTGKFIKVDKNSFNGAIDDHNFIELPYTEVIKNSSINFEENIQTSSKKTSLLGDLYDVSQGVVEATDKVSKKMSTNDFKKGEGVFVLSEQELKELNLDQKEKTIIKKYLNMNNIKKYYIDFDNEYLIYSGKEAKSEIFDGRYPHIKSHLDKMRFFITSSNAPYGLHRPRENKYFENPKLICKGMFLSPEFCFDNEKYYVGFSFSVIIQKDKDCDLKYLLGLLNSSFGKGWFNTNGKKRGIGVDIGVAVFRNFPVYKASKAEQKQIIILVDKMLSLNKELRETPENSDKWNSLKSEIEKTDRKIDVEVYKLYGLTEEEIKIVGIN
ncbi:MAG: N-6 DNA methylase [Candidatus Paceibacterota bacterium]|jgi:adenine-specific DNA-methyltransferase